jgi:small subunit ribosomal protein S2
MTKVKQKDLLDAGVHFGHLTRKWNPKMAPYILMERNGIHIIDLNKTAECLEEASNALKAVAKSGRKIMFVATKKQAQATVSEQARNLKMPFVTERWLGGMLTNFSTIRKSLKKMNSIDKLMKEEAYQNMAKRERLMVSREKAKLQKTLSGIADLTRLPAALFIIDIKREHIAVKEAQKLNIPVFAMVDTNSDPTQVDFPIPANDDAYKSINLITEMISKSIEEGLMERRAEKEEMREKEELEAKKQADIKGETEAEKPEPRAKTKAVKVDVEKESEGKENKKEKTEEKKPEKVSAKESEAKEA